jgi:phage terminase large subunit-like protein
MAVLPPWKTVRAASTIAGLLIVEIAQARRVALVAPTAADARDIMVEGESG